MNITEFIKLAGEKTGKMRGCAEHLINSPQQVKKIQYYRRFYLSCDTKIVKMISTDNQVLRNG